MNIRYAGGGGAGGTKAGAEGEARANRRRSDQRERGYQPQTAATLKPEGLHFGSEATLYGVSTELFSSNNYVITER